MKSAIIPEQTFKPLTIKQGETWALYVLLSVPNLRYTTGTKIGQVFASTPELDLLEGAGAADYPAFGSGLSEFGDIEYTFYAPRIFNGNLRYDYFAECPSEAPSTSIAPTPTPILKTSVKYTFHVEHGPEMSASNVPRDMERGVSSVLDGFLVDSNNDLNELVLNDGFYISSISAGVVPPAELRCEFLTTLSLTLKLVVTSFMHSRLFSHIMSRSVRPNSSEFMHSNFGGSRRQSFPICTHRASRILPLSSSRHSTSIDRYERVQNRIRRHKCSRHK